jgi:tRNA G18 (ribose-2'-O)-methylase SpoU
VSALTDLKANGIQLVAVETARGASPYHRFEYNFPVALVLGNEALGVSAAALRMCDAVVEIPVFGYKNSINVATAAGIVLYELLFQDEWLDGEVPEPTPPDGISESGT